MQHGSGQWQMNTSAEASLSDSNPGFEHVRHVKLYCDYKCVRAIDMEDWLCKLIGLLPKDQLLSFEYFPCRINVSGDIHEYAGLPTGILTELFASHQSMQHCLMDIGLVPVEEQLALAAVPLSDLRTLTVRCNSPFTVDEAARILSTVTSIKTVEPICCEREYPDWS